MSVSFSLQCQTYITSISLLLTSNFKLKHAVNQLTLLSRKQHVAMTPSAKTILQIHVDFLMGVIGTLPAPDMFEVAQATHLSLDDTITIWNTIRDDADRRKRDLAKASTLCSRKGTKRKAESDSENDGDWEADDEIEVDVTPDVKGKGKEKMARFTRSSTRPATRVSKKQATGKVGDDASGIKLKLPKLKPDSMNGKEAMIEEAQSDGKVSKFVDRRDDIEGTGATLFGDMFDEDFEFDEPWMKYVN